MKRTLLTLILGLSFGLCFGQFGNQVVISTEIENPKKLIATDINEDSFTDLLFVGGANKLYWLEGLDNQGNFSAPNILYDMVNNYDEIKLFDIDTDGLEDIVFLHDSGHSISYLKKLNNSASYATQVLLISNDDFFANNFQLLDMDGDEDIDIVTLGIEENSTLGRILSYENIDDTLQYGSENIAHTLSDFGPDDIFKKDIDGDGLFDIVGYDNFGFNSAVDIFYLKNIEGAGFADAITLYSFQFLISQQTTILSFDFTDINTDGLDDIMITTTRELGEGDELDRYWLENLDGQGAFSDPINSIYLSSFNTIGDADNDGDVDIIFSTNNGTEIDWVENNDGLGGFVAKPSITTDVVGLRSILLTDINNDKYPDVISASFSDNKIAWYPNFLLSVPENETAIFNAYPNPVVDFLNIESDLAIRSIEVYNVLGEVITTSTNATVVQLATISSGVYFVRITDIENNTQVQKIVKQ